MDHPSMLVMIRMSDISSISLEDPVGSLHPLHCKRSLSGDVQGYLLCEADDFSAADL